MGPNTPLWDPGFQCFGATKGPFVAKVKGSRVEAGNLKNKTNIVISNKIKIVKSTPLYFHVWWCHLQWGPRGANSRMDPRRCC